MAKALNNRAAWALVGTAIALAFAAQPLAACPFCTALKPSLSQLRDRADVVALAEIISTSDKSSDVRLHKVLKGREQLPAKSTLDCELDVAVRPGGLVLLFGEAGGEPQSDRLAWHAVAVDETSYGYFARAPGFATPVRERLAYFARYLEHADPLVAEDAYLEFGHTPFADVAAAADMLPAAQIRAWLVDPRVPPSRKGFYGLAIALCAKPHERRATADFLRTQIVAPADDFRAGFDGVLGGFLLLAADDGLQLIEERYLANPLAADGDVRHALTALRFYHEYGREISPARLAQALAHLLNRPEFAEPAIVDLARWQAWNLLDRVVAVYSLPASTAGTRRAVIGYLLACPQEPARKALARLRDADPRGVAAAEQLLSKTSSVPVSQ
ncbi:MAG: hypothetical protein AB7O59_02540 [Pirellulales bacterium]